MSHHEKAIEEARSVLIRRGKGLALSDADMRAAIVAFLATVEVSDKMREAAMAESVKRALMLAPHEYDALFRAMLSALSDEVGR